MIEQKPIWDDITRWADLSTWDQPAFDVKGYQNRIDNIVGRNRDGKSIVVLRWMRSRDCYDEIYTEWDIAGQPTKSALRAKYRAFGVALPDGNTLEIPPPRWVLEQRYEPEQLAATWDTDRWVEEDGRKVPVKGSLPREGYYSHLWTIAGHTDTCCDEALEVSSVCWGTYRLPSERDLNTLRGIIKRRDEDTVTGNPYGEVDIDSQTELIRRTREQVKAQADFKSEKTREVIKDAMRPHLHRLTDDPSVLKHGKYHFLNSKKEKK